MKKTICTALIILLCLNSLSVSIFAAEKASPSSDSTSFQNIDGLIPAIDPERLPEELPSVEGMQVLPVFHVVGWEYAAMENFGDTILRAVEDVGVDYVILDETPFVLYDNHDSHRYSLSVFDSIPTYVSDIMNSGSEIRFLDTVNSVESIICFDGSRSYRETIVYFITDNGVYVRVYNNAILEYALEDFQTNSKLYYDFLNHYHEYDELMTKEHGRTLGGPPRFDYFMNDPEAVYAEYTILPWTERYPWALPSICCVAVMILVPAALLIVHNVRKKREQVDE